MTLQNFEIKMTSLLNPDDAARIKALEKVCNEADGTSLKLELDYKLGVAAGGMPEGGLMDVNELMAFDGGELIGYAGIGCFGGAGAMPEVMGMVRPDFRGRGVFKRLHGLVALELTRRGFTRALLLSDGRSASGQAFIRKLGAEPHHSEYEMYLRGDGGRADAPDLGIGLRKASNADAAEVARQNAIYFGEEAPEGEAAERGLMLPEEEEKRGMTIWMAERDGLVIGKVHLQLLDGLGGIYGLGVLPEYRGKGYGRAILMDGVNRLKAAGAAEVMLQVATGNRNALGLYESCGFQTTSTMDYYVFPLVN